MASEQKEISVAEFFERNKQILGFDSQTRVLITAVKEAVDNSLDACEEAMILPTILIEIEETSKWEYKIAVEDNGPGILKHQIPNVFGRLLYGSRFHAVRQSRGQQGIGISAVVMYSQLSTGKPAYIISKTSGSDVAHFVKLILDTKKNRPNIIEEDFTIWEGRQHGTRIEVYLKGRYLAGKQSVWEYLKSTAIVNPHAQITFKDPTGKVTVLQRATDQPPRETKQIKPHPEGIELGQLINMAKATEARRLTSFLVNEFSRVSPRVAKEICQNAQLPEDMRPKSLSLEQAKAMISAIEKVKIMAPESECLSPIGEILIRKGLKNVLDGLKPRYYVPPVTREPKVYNGNPFQVEVGIVHGGELPADQPVEILRFANRVPLMYQQGADVITKAVANVDWRRYGLEQRGGQGIPFGPAIILVHVASTKVPFTSEAKDAIANIELIQEEMELALKECARRLKTHLNKSARRAKSKEKFDIVQVLLPEIAKKAAKIVGKPVPDLGKTVTNIMNVVWVNDSVEFVSGRHKITIDVYNYTATGKKLNVHAIAPEKNLDTKKLNPKPDIIKGEKLTWELKRIPSVEKATITFELAGLDKEGFTDVDVFVSGINPAMVIGAEPLPGDWDLDGIAQQSLTAFGEEAEAEEPVAEEEENGEVDYDKAKEAVNDDE
jgi:DNA topoisomerase-6 subunit B